MQTTGPSCIKGSVRMETIRVVQTINTATKMLLTLLFGLALSVSLTQACNSSACYPQGPPGRDGRDGIPGPPGPASPLVVELTALKRTLIEDLKAIVAKEIQDHTKLRQNCNSGTQPQLAASSCEEVHNCNHKAPSGKYWIAYEDKDEPTIREVYCNMETRCGEDGGWTRVAYINMTEQNSCPHPLSMYTSPRKMCARSNPTGCTSVKFPTLGIEYSRVCGQAIGYERATPSAFHAVGRSIDSTYVEGVSITYGNPKKHIWTLAVGLSKNHPYSRWNCPCATHPGDAPPSFVGNDYHCESGTYGAHNFDWYPDPIWDGKNCPAGNSCCSNAGMPWFSKVLPQPTNEGIETRFCCDEVPSNEDFGVTLLELYVK